MNDTGQIQLIGETNLLTEAICLSLLGKLHVMIVQAHFAHRYHFFICHSRFAHPLKVLWRQLGHITRVNPQSRPHKVIALGVLQRLAVRFLIEAHHDHLAHPRVISTLNHLFSILVESFCKGMAMGVGEH